MHPQGPGPGLPVCWIIPFENYVNSLFKGCKKYTSFHFLFFSLSIFSDSLFSYLFLFFVCLHFMPPGLCREGQLLPAPPPLLCHWATLGFVRLRSGGHHKQRALTNLNLNHSLVGLVNSHTEVNLVSGGLSTKFHLPWWSQSCPNQWKGGLVSGNQ